MIRVMVSLGDGPYSGELTDLLDCAGGIETILAPVGEDPAQAALRARPDIVVADPATLPGIIGSGFPGRILLVYGEGKNPAQHLPGPPVCGIIKKGSGGLVLQTAIKAVARGVEWVDCAPGGIEGLNGLNTSGGSPEKQAALA
ncbi:MAG: hypothetical protein HS130_09650 [Deltaproteobacteria bacterium]|nr:hypothetical protein [Deltaproteobacteria bacterium]MCL4873000.1 hypothetical protein [bacterium]